MLSIQLQNTVTKQVYEFSDIEDKNNGKKLFYKFNLNLTDVPEGEYEVTLYKDGEVIKKELLKLGDFNNKGIQYSKGNNIFIDSKPEFNVVSKRIGSNGEYFPNEGELWNRVDVYTVNQFDLNRFPFRFKGWRNVPRIIANSSYEGLEWNKNNGSPIAFVTTDITDFSNFIVDCDVEEVSIDAGSGENFDNMIVDCPKLYSLLMVGLQNSFSYSPYTNLELGSVEMTVGLVNDVNHKEEKPILNLSKYTKYIDEAAIASAVAKGWLIVGVNIIPEYNVNLNDQWRLSEEIPNPYPEQFDGVYESFSNWNVNGGIADMSIEIENYTDFTIYIRSDAESGYDYVDIYELDKKYTGNVYATTQDTSNSGTDIGAYKKITFTNIPLGKHTIYIRYKKDGSANSGTDRGYVLIPKQQ